MTILTKSKKSQNVIYMKKNMTKCSKIHIGEMIKEKVKERKMSTVEFAQAIKISRPNVYNLYKQPSIDIDKLMMISEVLKFDFVGSYYDYYKKEQMKQKSKAVCIFVEYCDGQLNVTHQEIKDEKYLENIVRNKK